jgi:hypothetical protein
MKHDGNETDESLHRVAAYVVHTSTELRETCSAALAHAGYLVFSAADCRKIHTEVGPAKGSLAIAVVEHVMGDRKPSWEYIRRTLPRVTVILGLVEVVGPGGAAEAALVTKNEGEVFGPMPIAEVPATIGRLLSHRRGRATSLERPPHRGLDLGRKSLSVPAEPGLRSAALTIS